MKLSTRSRYGTRLMLDMAEHYGEGPIQLSAIARRQSIPVKYLEQIIIPLKKARYITSVRGAKGGHMLARPPEEISVREVVELLEGGLKLTECAENPQICSRSSTCVTRILWKESTQAMVGRLKEISLSDLKRMSDATRERADSSAAGQSPGIEPEIVPDKYHDETEGAEDENCLDCYQQEERNPQDPRE